MSSIFEAALEYAARGWPVFPCESRGKRPLTRNGFKDASTDEAQIRVWWKRNPNANVAIPTGVRTFDVLDIDGPDGERSLAELEARHDELPTGPRQITGRGRQLWFSPGSLMQSAGRLPGIDTRGEGGYVVVAPSVHPSGAIYALEDDGEPLPEPPAWLLAELRGEGMARELPDLGPPVVVEDETARTLLSMAGIPLAAVPSGQRNDRLFRWGASLRARGQEHESILFLLRLANAHLCSPRLDETELRRIAASAARLSIATAYVRAEEAVDRQVSKVAEQRQHEERAEAALRAVETEDDAGRLETARSLLRVPLSRVIQSGKNPPAYYLVVDTAGGEERIRVPNLLSYADVKRKLLDHFGVVLSVRQKEWDSAATLLRALAVHEDPGLADEREALIHMVCGFVRSETPTPVSDDDELREARFTGAAVIHRGEETWIAFDAFREWLDRAGMRDGVSTLWRRMIEAGVLREAPKSFRRDGRVVCRRYWVAESARVLEAGPPR